MRLIELDKAADQIRRACARGGPHPFFFIVGAGLSSPPIPLASEIEEHCRNTAKAYAARDDSLGMTAIDRYSHWFDRAYEQPILRQEYLRGLIEGSAISHANFRLAHLLLDKTISNIVVTPNFDDFLSKALTLFGAPPIVCDHPKTVERINPEQPDIQILHVHGTYWFYDCCNLRDEIENRAKTSEQTNTTMAFKLDDILSRRSPLVIGYSGWEGDVIMSALKRRLQSDLPYNLYWFCYKHGVIDSLPTWLKSHPRVYLVTPRANPSLTDVHEETAELSKRLDEAEQLYRKALEIASEADDSLEGISEQRTSPLLESETRGYPDRKEEEARLSAQDVLDSLIQSFDLRAPELTTDPLGFFANYLRELLPQDDTEKATSSVYYSFGSVVERIERAKQNETIQANELELEQIRDALRRSQYREAILLGGRVSLNDLNQSQLLELMNAISTAASALKDGSVEELEGYELVNSIADTVSQHDIDEPRVREPVAKALVSKGYRLGTLNRNDEAVATYDEVLRRFGESTEPSLRVHVARALVNKGITLGTMNRSEEAIATHDEVIRRFGDATEQALLDLVARSLVNKGYSLGSLNRNEEAVATYDEVLRRFGENTEPSLREDVARALVNKGITLGTMNRSEEAIATHDEVIRRFGDAAEQTLLDLVARSLEHKGYRLGRLNRGEEAIATYDELLGRLGEATELGLREQLARTLVNKGYRLGILNRNEEALAIYDEVLRRFSEAAEPVLREAMARALVNKADRLACLNRREEAISVCHDVITRFGEVPEPAVRELVARALLNKSVALRHLNRNEEAVATHDEVVRRFSQATELAVREHVARALQNKGHILDDLNRREEATAARDEVITRFGEAKEPSLRESVARALNTEGFKLLCEAKQAWAASDEADARADLIKAQERINDALEYNPNNAFALGNKGYIDFLLGNETEALEALEQAIELGGEKIQQGELEDSNIHPLPQDKKFRELVLSIPLPESP